MKYFDWFIKKSQIARDLLELGLFPNSKEIDESYAMLNCIYNVLGLRSQFESVLCIVVGDGARPRTACTISFNTQWTAVSIDPLLQNLKTELIEKLSKVKRLKYYPYKIEEINFDTILNNVSDYEYIIIIHPHSHADLNYSIGKIKRSLKPDHKVLAISMSCCVPDNYARMCLSFIDKNIHSPKNRINIYPIQNINIENFRWDKIKENYI
jgi:hypothetical protein